MCIQEYKPYRTYYIANLYYKEFVNIEMVHVCLLLLNMLLAKIQSK